MMLCKNYNISVNNIVSHKEAHDKGYGSAHVDPHHWWDKHGYTMDGFRKAVKSKMSTVVKVKTSKDCNLYREAYKDPVGDSVKSIKVKKGTQLTWKKDNGYGWSKVKYNGNTYYIMNDNLNKSGLSSCKKKKLTKKTAAKKVKNGKFTKTKTLKRVQKLKLYVQSKVVSIWVILILSGVQPGLIFMLNCSIKGV